MATPTCDGAPRRSESTCCPSTASCSSSRASWPCRARAARRSIDAFTSDASFAIDKDKDAVYLRALRRLSGLDYEEFEDLLHTMASVADEWDDRLAQIYSSDR
jgi:hypothetical protein